MMRFFIGTNSNIEMHSYYGETVEHHTDVDVIVSADEVINLFKRLLDSAIYLDEEKRATIYGVARKIDNTMSFPMFQEKISCDECSNKYNCYRCENFDHIK